MQLLPKIQKLLKNTQGGVAILFAMSIIPMILAVGMAVDYSEAARLKSAAANSTDAALLAAASIAASTADLDDEAAVLSQLQANFQLYYYENMTTDSRYTYRGFTLTYDPAVREIRAHVKYEYDTSFMGIVGINKMDVNVVASTRIQMSSGGAISMYLVLDRSGSMSWSATTNQEWGTPYSDSRIFALKEAVADMIGQLETKDPTHEFTRMGAVSYHSEQQSPQNLAWGTALVNAYVQALPADGGTNSWKAVRTAYRALKGNSEENKHQAQSGQSPKRVILFMTDGDNNDPSYDRKTLKFCGKAKNKGIEIFTVAFKAPSGGEALLQECATDASHYFDASDADELALAFMRIGAAVAQNLVLTQ